MRKKAVGSGGDARALDRMHVLCKSSEWASFGTPDCRVPCVAEVFCTNNDDCKRIFVCWDFGARALITSWPGGWLAGKDPVFAL
jgi:hypothetical protein